MSDSKSRSVLQNHYKPGDYGAVIGAIPGVMFKERRVASLFQINGLRSFNSEVFQSLGVSQLPTNNKSVVGDDVVLMWNGPGMVLLESEIQSSKEIGREVRTLLESTDATVTDLSSARTILRVSGNDVREFLKKGCPVNVDMLGAGDVVSTLLGHNSVTIHCVDTSFDIYILQSFGLDLWHWCQHNAREFGYRVETVL